MSQYHEIEIIGFDLGHGETAVTKVRADNNEPPESLEINKKKTQITAIAYGNGGQKSIGQKAIIAARRGHEEIKEFHISFKKSLLREPTYEGLIRDFVIEVYNCLRSEKQIFGDEKNIFFFIGCPSGWNDEEIDSYKMLLSDFLPNIRVVRESRAALMHAKESGKFTLAELQDSILVIDIGSSTTDITLVTGVSNNKPLDFGYELGGAFIDKAILEKTLEEHPHKELLRKIFERHPKYKFLCELECRKAKETYFSNPEMYENTFVEGISLYINLMILSQEIISEVQNFLQPALSKELSRLQEQWDSLSQTLTDLENKKSNETDPDKLLKLLKLDELIEENDKQRKTIEQKKEKIEEQLYACKKRRVPFEPFLDKKVIEDIIHQQPSLSLVNQSFYDAFYTRLTEVKKRLDKQGIKPRAILLTGGASKMDFIRDLCRKVFPNSPYQPDTEPEFAIARGLARYGRLHIRSQRFKNDIISYLKQDIQIIIENNLPNLLDSLASKLAKEIVRGVLKPRLKSWCSGSIKTINNLESDITHSAKSYLEGNEARKLIGSQINQWLLNDIFQEIVEQTKPICKEYHLPLSVIKNQGIDFNVDTANLGQISVGDPTILAPAIAAIMGVVIAIVIRFIGIFGIVGWIMGAFIGVFTAIGSKEQIEKFIKSADIPKWIRDLVSDAMLEQFGEERIPELAEEIRNTLADDSELEPKLVRNITLWVNNAVQEQVEKAKLLIA